jgi:hypothetical protein
MHPSSSIAARLRQTVFYGSTSLILAIWRQACPQVASAHSGSYCLAPHRLQLFLPSHVTSGRPLGGGDSLGRRKIYLCRAGNSPIVKNICVGCRSKEYKFGYEGGFTQFPLATNSNSCANVNLTTQLVLRFFYYYIRSLTGRLTALHPRIQHADGISTWVARRLYITFRPISERK